MNGLLNGSFMGHYALRGNPYEADSMAAFEFSHRPETMPVGQPNIDIAEVVDTAGSLYISAPEKVQGIHLPLFASRSIARGIEHLRASGQLTVPLTVTSEFEGTSAQGVHENLGTYGEVRQLFDEMMQRNLRRPLLITSAYNIGNITFQALRIAKELDVDIDPIVIPGLPRSFDSLSDQVWTQSLAKWRATTHARQGLLRLRGH